MDAARGPDVPSPEIQSVFDAIVAPAEVPREPSKGAPTCPSCARKPLLERFPRYEAVTYEPLMYCYFCHGFWARGDSLSRGVADPYTDHPALHDVPVSRCRSCGGRLDPQQTCRKCGWTPSLLDCPSCHRQMQRARVKSVTLDVCKDCKGVWFETGEINALFGLAGQPMSMFERMVPATPQGEGFGIDEVADLISLALMFLP